MTVDETLLGTRLNAVSERLPERREEVDALAMLVRSGSDHDVVRINPLRVAQEHGLDEAKVVEVFLHARKVGLLHMEWQYVCPGCGDHRELPVAHVRDDALFTDIKGSTAMYERVGDMKAFDLVRLHFGFLRESIARNSGALVKTIGDAVMASFSKPSDALHAALDMHERIARFNTEAGQDLVALKMGAHTGACLAVTLNGRLDHFGQAVNLAARVQALSQGNEIVLTEELLAAPRVRELLDGHPLTAESVELKGIQGAVRIYRLRRAIPVE